ncbi:YycH family regulatory protein [Dellaglioa sp. P0083]|uniref:YycH family regulatory protein n=1 Tax=Dellaglioa kimchii TaxID=3344667 RepID=UPI0038D4F746
MKLNRFILPTILFLLIMTSIGLSWVIWTNPTWNGKSESTKATNSTQTELTKSTKLSEVYAPTSVIYNDNQQQNVLYSEKINIISNIQRKIRTWKETSISEVSIKNKNDYLTFLNAKNQLVLSYSDEITVGLFNQVFNQQNQNYKTRLINRVIIPRDNKKSIYLLSDKDKKIYEISLNDAYNKGKTIDEVVQNETLSKLPVTFKLHNNDIFMYYNQDFNIARFRYLVDKQTASKYVANLLGQKDGSSVNIKESKKTITYYDGSDRQLTVQNATNLVSFEDDENSDAKQKTSRGNALTESYTSIKNTGIGLDNIHFYQFNGKSMTTTFRSYIEGFPIFNQTKHGVIEVERLDNGGNKIDFSLLTLQIAVPSGKADVMLPSTEEVLSSLVTAGYKDADISDIQLGYRWVSSSDSDLVVNLEPTWYIRYQDKWKSYTELLQTD